MRRMGRPQAFIAKALRLMGMNKTHKKFIDYWWASYDRKVKRDA